jgi:hypothetical protein
MPDVDYSRLYEGDLDTLTRDMSMEISPTGFNYLRRPDEECDSGWGSNICMATCEPQEVLLGRNGDVNFGDGQLPRFYEHSVNCEWVILPMRDVAAEGTDPLDATRFEVIELTFHRADLGVGDAIHVYDGPSSGEGARAPILSLFGEGLGMREHAFGSLGTGDNIHGENGFARSETGIMTVQMLSDAAPAECMPEGLVMQWEGERTVNGAAQRKECEEGFRGTGFSFSYQSNPALGSPLVVFMVIVSTAAMMLVLVLFLRCCFRYAPCFEASREGMRIRAAITAANARSDEGRSDLGLSQDVIDLFVVYRFSNQKTVDVRARARSKTRKDNRSRGNAAGANSGAVVNADLESELENITALQRGDMDGSIDGSIDGSEEEGTEDGEEEEGEDGEEENEEDCCCICLGDYEDDEELRMLPCLHAFHKECIDSWLHINHICPLCKKDVQTMLAEKFSMLPLVQPGGGGSGDANARGNASGNVSGSIAGGEVSPSAFSLRQAQQLGQSSYSDALGGSPPSRSSGSSVGSGGGGGGGSSDSSSSGRNNRPLMPPEASPPPPPTHATGSDRAFRV